jgi:hypothetical protein
MLFTRYYASLVDTIDAAHKQFVKATTQTDSDKSSFYHATEGIDP